MSPLYNPLPMRVAAAIALLFLSSFLLAESRGACPSMPSSLPASSSLAPALRRDPPSPDLQYAGRAIVAVVVSDRGYVCSDRIVDGFGKDADDKVLESVKKWRFKPAARDGHPVSVVATVEVVLWRHSDGTLALDLLEKQKQADSPGSDNTAK